MKPYEEQWHHKGREPLVRTEENYIRAVVYGAGIKAAPDDETARLIAAAPDMARALLADMVLWEDGVMHDEFRCPILAAGTCADWCAAKRDALRKAGVLP